MAISDDFFCLSNFSAHGACLRPFARLRAGGLPGFNPIARLFVGNFARRLQPAVNAFPRAAGNGMGPPVKFL